MKRISTVFIFKMKETIAIIENNNRAGRKNIKAALKLSLFLYIAKIESHRDTIKKIVLGW